MGGCVFRSEKQAVQRGSFMRILRAGEKEFEQYLSEVEGRGARDVFRFERKARSILKDVKKRGDEALLHYTRVFDGLRFTVHRLQVKTGEVKRAYGEVPPDLLGTLKRAAQRIERFHRLQSKRLIPS